MFKGQRVAVPFFGVGIIRSFDEDFKPPRAEVFLCSNGVTAEFDATELRDAPPITVEPSRRYSLRDDD